MTGLVYLWVAVYSSGQTVGTYTLSGILVYYIVLTVLRITISEGVGHGFEVSNEIKDGIVANYLLKPFNYSIERFLKLVAGATINFIVIGPIVATLAFFSRNYIDLPGIVGWLSFIGFALIGLVFYYLIYYFTALSAFWVHRGQNFIYGMLLFSNLLNGGMLPLDLFPEWFQPISNLLPFRFLIYVPIQAFMGRIVDWIPLLLTAGAWIIILILLIAFTWNRGVRKFEAVGR